MDRVHGILKTVLRVGTMNLGRVGGILEAKKAGELLIAENINIDHAYTSYLKRAKNTLKIILKNMSLENINIIKYRNLMRGIMEI